MSNHLTLVFPQANEAIKSPSLQYLLKKSQTTPLNLECKQLEPLLFKLFSLPYQEELPVAALTGLADKLNTQQNYWLRADPIELRADLAAVYCFAADPTQLEASLLEEVIKQLKVLVKLDGLTLHVPHPNRWYIEMDFDPEIKTFSPAEVIGKNISPYLPTGKKAVYWRKLFTEIQMLIHGCQNTVVQQGQQRESFNGLWFWGAGKLPEAPSTVWQKVWSDEGLAKGLSLLTEVSCSDLPQHVHDCLSVLEEGSQLVVFNPLEPINLLEANWFKPLIKALRKKRVASVEFYLGDEKIHRVMSKDVLWWSLMS